MNQAASPPSPKLRQTSNLTASLPPPRAPAAALAPPEGLPAGPRPRLGADGVGGVGRRRRRRRSPPRDLPDRRPLLSHVAEGAPVGEHRKRPLLLLRTALLVVGAVWNEGGKGVRPALFCWGRVVEWGSLKACVEN